MNVSGVGPLRPNKSITPSGKKDRKVSSRQEDSVTIGDHVRVGNLVDKVRDIPDTRPEQVEEARERASQKHYDDPEVQKQTAANLLESGDLEGSP